MKTGSQQEIFSKLRDLFADPEPGLYSWWFTVRQLLADIGFAPGKQVSCLACGRDYALHTQAEAILCLGELAKRVWHP